MSAAIVREMVRKYALDLRGLTVYTEAATGPYAWCAALAAYAGAEVMAVGPADARDESGAAARELGVSITCEVHPRDVWFADIITNTGHVRPIGAAMAEEMKPTAVVPLMWETWEHRADEVDMDAMHARGIVCMGTDESTIGYDRWLEAMACELAEQRNSCGVSVFGTSFSDALESGGCAPAGSGRPIAFLSEHSNPAPMFGTGGTFSVDDIAGFDVVHVCGNVGDIDAVRAAAHSFWPETPAPFGHMSVSPAILGADPVLDLYAAGLAVGACLARARLAGMSPRDAARHALVHSPAQDFEGAWSWTA